MAKKYNELCPVGKFSFIVNRFLKIVQGIVLFATACAMLYVVSVGNLQIDWVDRLIATACAVATGAGFFIALEYLRTPFYVKGQGHDW